MYQLNYVNWPEVVRMNANDQKRRRKVNKNKPDLKGSQRRLGCHHRHHHRDRRQRCDRLHHHFLGGSHLPTGRWLDLDQLWPTGDWRCYLISESMLMLLHFVLQWLPTELSERDVTRRQVEGSQLDGFRGSSQIGNWPNPTLPLLTSSRIEGHVFGTVRNVHSLTGIKESQSKCKRLSLSKALSGGYYDGLNVHYLHQSQNRNIESTVVMHELCSKQTCWWGRNFLWDITYDGSRHKATSHYTIIFSKMHIFYSEYLTIKLLDWFSRILSSCPETEHFTMGQKFERMILSSPRWLLKFCPWLL